MGHIGASPLFVAVLFLGVGGKWCFDQLSLIPALNPMRTHMETVQGLYTGTVQKWGRTRLSVWTRDTPENSKTVDFNHGKDHVLHLYLEPRVNLRNLPPPGSAVKITYNNVNPGNLRIVRSEDIGCGVYPMPYKFIKIRPDYPWYVQDGRAYNGEGSYRTQLPNGTYQQLSALVDCQEISLVRALE